MNQIQLILIHIYLIVVTYGLYDSKQNATLYKTLYKDKKNPIERLMSHSFFAKNKNKFKGIKLSISKSKSIEEIKTKINLGIKLTCTNEIKNYSQNEGINCEIDTNVWLKANGLECLISKMKNENLTMLKKKNIKLLKKLDSSSSA